MRRLREAVEAFNELAAKYDSWYEEHPYEYRNEVTAIKRLVPGGLGLDVGVGTGIIASEVGVEVGLDASLSMLRTAKSRGLEVVRAQAERTPFKGGGFDYVLTTATLCFLEDVEEALREAYRVLKPGGFLVACIIPRESPWGRRYAERGDGVYRLMRLLGVEELKEAMLRAGFEVAEALGTISYPPSSVGFIEEPSVELEGKSFVCIKGLKRGG